MNEYRRNSDKVKRRYEDRTIFVRGRVTYVASSAGYVVLEDVLDCFDFYVGSERAMYVGQKVIIRGRFRYGSLHDSRLMG